jgi:hypothetical protein
MGTMVRDAMTRIEREIECFGIAKNQMQIQLDEALKWQNHKQIAMSLMSDAQEEIERGLPNKARQSLNRAKWVLCQTNEVK